MVTIWDALMGTGKSTAMFEKLNSELDQKFIILTPFITEVIRYKEAISADFSGKRNDVVALDEISGRTKKRQFLDAVWDGKTVVTTHALFSQLSMWDLSGFSNNEYHLIIDETITLVDQTGLLSGDLQDLVDLSRVRRVSHPTISGLDYYEILEAGIAYIERNKGKLVETLNSVSGKHVYVVNRTNVLFVVPPEKITGFKDVTLMTYMFNKSEAHAWLEIFGIPYSHLKLERSGSIHSFSKHDKRYTGHEYKSLLKVYEDDKLDEIGKKNPRSKGPAPLTMSWYKRKSTTAQVEIKKLSNSTRSFFRHMKQNFGAKRSEMLWASPRDYKDILRHSEFDIKAKDKDGDHKNWISFNMRATNKYKDKRYLAYLVNVHPHQNIVEFFKKHSAPFSRDIYALSTLLQCLWRSGIREGLKVTLYLPSERMRGLLSYWLMWPLERVIRKVPKIS